MSNRISHLLLLVMLCVSGCDDASSGGPTDRVDASLVFDGGPDADGDPDADLGANDSGPTPSDAGPTPARDDGSTSPPSPVQNELLRTLLTRCWEKDPKDRPTMKEVRAQHARARARTHACILSRESEEHHGELRIFPSRWQTWPKAWSRRSKPATKR